VQDKVPYISGWKEPISDVEADVHVSASEFVTITSPSVGAGAAVVGTGVGDLVVGFGVGAVEGDGVGDSVGGADFVVGAGVGGFEGGLVGGPHVSAFKHSSKGI
jgi:hypothetical protein